MIVAIEECVGMIIFPKKFCIFVLCHLYLQGPEAGALQAHRLWGNQDRHQVHQLQVSCSESDYNSTKMQQAGEACNREGIRFIPDPLPVESLGGGVSGRVHFSRFFFTFNVKIMSKNWKRTIKQWWKKNIVHF